MRKTVEIAFELILIIVICMPCILLLVWLATEQILMTTSYSFLLVQCIIFASRVINQTWLIEFLIDNHVAAEVIEIAFEVT